MKKKYLSLFLCLALLLSLIPTWTVAADAATLTIGNGDGAAIECPVGTGCDIPVTLEMKAAGEAYSIMFQLKNKAAEVVTFAAPANVENVLFDGMAALNPTCNDGGIYNVTSTNNALAFAGSATSGRLCTIHVTPKAGVYNGTYEIEVVTDPEDPSAVTYQDGMSDDVALTVVAGKIRITGGLDPTLTKVQLFDHASTYTANSNTPDKTETWPEDIPVTADGTNDVVFYAKGFAEDEASNKDMTADTTWTTTAAATNLTVDPVNTDGYVPITIKARAATGTYTVTATNGLTTKTLGFAVSRNPSVAQSVTLATDKTELLVPASNPSAGDNAVANFTVTATDQYGGTMPDPTITWKVDDNDAPTVDGITFPSGNAKTLTVDSTAKASILDTNGETYAIKAMVDNATSDAVDVTVKRAAQVIQSIALTPTTKTMGIPTSETDIASLFTSIAVTDQYGTVSEPTITWSASPAVPGVTVADGKITVANTVTDNATTTLTATCGGETDDATITFKKISFALNDKGLTVANGTYGAAWSTLITKADTDGITADVGENYPLTGNGAAWRVIATPESGDATTFEVSTGTISGDNATKKPAAGTYTVKLQFKDNTYTSWLDVDTKVVTVAKKPLTINATGLTITKVYDGTTDAGTATGALALTGVEGSDVVSITYTTVGAYADADVSASKTVTISGLALDGVAKDNYKIADDATTYSFTSAAITKATLAQGDLDVTLPTGLEYDATTGKTASVEVKSPKTGLGTVTVKYQKGSETATDTAPKAVGEYKVLITTSGATNFTDVTDFDTGKTFTINPKNITPVVTLTLPTGGYTYDGTAKEPTFVVKESSDENAATIPASEYTAAYSNNTNAGNSATLTITDKDGGNYTWASPVDKTFSIAAKSIADGRVSGYPTSMEYTGSNLEPAVTVKDGSKTLTLTTDYTVSYSDNTNVGTATITVTGAGNYTGTVTPAPTFTITPLTLSGSVTISSNATPVAASSTLTAKLALTSPATASDVDYQWMLNGEDIGSATDPTYAVPNPAPENGKYTVKVTAKDSSNFTGSLTSAAVEVGKATLGDATLTIKKGNDAVTSAAKGDALTAVAANLPTGLEATGYTITWYRDGSPISGATGANYTVVAADQGHSISAKLTAEGYTGEIASSPVAVDAGTPTLTVTATAGNAQATVNWSVEANGATITQFTVQCKDGSTVIETVTVDASTKSHTFTGLTNNTEYTFKVTAIYNSGTADSTEVKATPKAPSTPSNPTTPTTPSSTDTSTIGGGGGGGGYTPRDRDTDSSTTTNKSTTTNADGSITTTVKNSDGSVTETTRATDGSTTTTKTEKTGEATTTEKAADGSTGTTKTDAAGNTVAASATVSQQAVRNAARYGSAVKVPVSVKASNSAASAAAVDIALPETSEPVAVEIPVENVSAGTVAVIVHPDGTEEIVKTSTVGKDGVVLTLDGSAKVKIVDNSKYFADVPSNEWYADNVAWASSREIMNGTGDFAFAPNDPTSRSMVAQLLFNLDGAAAPNEITTLFADVNPSDWYANSVTWAVSSGIARGMGDNLFGADQVVTREQFAVMMYNYAQLKGYDVSTSSSLTSFPDADGVSDWAADAMAWAVGVGLINGTTDANGNTVLNAQGTATRAQVAAIMQRFCEKVAK